MKIHITLVALAVLLVGCTSMQAAPPATAAGSVSGSDLLELDRQADLAYRDGRHEAAAQAYGELVRAVDDDPQYWYRLGNAYVRLGRLTEAAMAYEQTLALDPSNARAWHNLGVVLVARAREALAQGVRLTPAGDAVHEESLRLSRQLSPPGAEADRAPLEAAGGLGD
jgi:Flp pilus assembly protein TadD